MSQVLGSALAFSLMPNFKSGKATPTIFFFKIKRSPAKPRTVSRKFSFHRSLFQGFRWFKCAFQHNLITMSIKRHQANFITLTKQTKIAKGDKKRSHGVRKQGAVVASQY